MYKFIDLYINICIGVTWMVKLKFIKRHLFKTNWKLLIKNIYEFSIHKGFIWHRVILLYIINYAELFIYDLYDKYKLFLFLNEKNRHFTRLTR